MSFAGKKRLDKKCNDRRLKELVALGCVLGTDECSGIIYSCKEDAAVDAYGLYTRSLYQWETEEWCRIYGRMSQRIAAQKEINGRIAKRSGAAASSTTAWSSQK